MRVAFASSFFIGLALLVPDALQANPLEKDVLIATPHGFGKPVKIPNSLYSKRKGILRCSRLVIGSCFVDNMPLISQSDPDVRDEFAAYLQTFAVDGKVKGPDGNLSTPLEYANGVVGVGCFDTSIVLALHAAIENRLPSITISKRTKEFNDQAPSGKLTEKIQRQLLWHYQRKYEYSQSIKKDGKVVQPMYFPEAVADAGGGVKESCDPYNFGGCGDVNAVNGLANARQISYPAKADLTHELIKKQMYDGNIFLLEFQRWVHTSSLDANTGALTVTFTYHSAHKVDIGGFNYGKYQILISDVGSGTHHGAYISSDLAAHPAFKKHGVKSVKFSFTPSTGVSLPSADKPYLVYDGDEINYVRFIRVYHTLKIASK